MRTVLSRVLVAVVLVAATAVPAAAQQTAVGQPRASVGAGFMILHWLDSESTSKGLAVDFAMPVTLGGKRNFSIVGDMTLGKDDEETDFTLGGGLRFTAAVGRRVRVYGQGLFGLSRWSADDESDEAFFAAPGGGVFIPLTDKVDIKGQVDLFLPSWDGYTDNLFRVFLGVNFQLGTK